MNWPVHRSYFITGEWIEPWEWHEDVARYYDPLTEPDVMWDFMAVGEGYTRNALEFVRRWGMLTSEHKEYLPDFWFELRQFNLFVEICLAEDPGAPYMKRLFRECRDLPVVAAVKGNYRRAGRVATMLLDSHLKVVYEPDPHTWKLRPQVKTLLAAIWYHAENSLVRGKPTVRVGRCVECGTAFRADKRHPHQKFCTARCANRVRKRKEREG